MSVGMIIVWYYAIGAFIIFGLFARTTVDDWVKCNDGFVFSVQASDFHRSHIKDGVVTHYEVGFPSTPPQYIDMNGDDVAEFVDADRVVGEINYHGGIAYDEYQMDV
jgi:hypothetical protein